jgi:hypothetical protein
MSASQNWFGAVGLGTFLFERIISDLRLPGVLQPSFWYILATFFRFTGSPDCLASWAAIRRVPYVGLFSAISMIFVSIRWSVATFLGLFV